MRWNDGGATAPWPVALFASVMGLAGLALAWRLAAQGTVLSWVSDAFAASAWLMFMLLCAVQWRRLRRDRAAWLAELRQPAGAPFAGTFWISLLLLPMLLPAYAVLPARALWLFGASGMVVFAWRICRSWLTERQVMRQVSAAWLIPAVGLLDIPLAFPALGWPAWREVMVIALAGGWLLAAMLFVLACARLLFHPAWPPALRPSLLILSAPFAVGFSAYVALAGAVDAFARALFYLDVLLLVLLLPRTVAWLRGQPFLLSWWALGFPLAASAVAALRYAKATPSVWAEWLALALLFVASGTVAALAWRSLRGLLRGERMLPVPAR
jgi:tellurite resistance protein